MAAGLLTIDIGGTHTRLALWQQGKIVKKAKFFTKQDLAEEIDFVCQKVKDWRFKSLACCAPGVFRSNGEIVSSINLPFWQGKNLRRAWQRALKTPVFLFNDAQAAALGEAIFGAGKGFKIGAYLTLSTGIGGARFEKGKITANFLGFEPGKQIIEWQNFSCWENYLGGRFLAKNFHRAPAKIKKEKWKKLFPVLLAGLQNVLIFWSPEVIILNGPVARQFSLLDIKKKLAEQNQKIFSQMPVIKRAALGDQSGIYGLAYLAKKS